MTPPSLGKAPDKVEKIVQYGAIKEAHVALTEHKYEAAIEFFNLPFFRALLGLKPVH